MSFLFVVNFVAQDDNPLSSEISKLQKEGKAVPTSQPLEANDVTGAEPTSDNPSADNGDLDSERKTEAKDEAKNGSTSKIDAKGQDVTIVNETTTEKSATGLSQTSNSGSDVKKDTSLDIKNEGMALGTDNATETPLQADQDINGPRTVADHEVDSTDMKNVKSGEEASKEQPAVENAVVDDVDKTVNNGTSDTDSKTGSEEKAAVDPSYLTPLLKEVPLWKRALKALKTESVSGVFVDQITDTSGTNFIRISFIEADSQKCETVLNKLKKMGVGSIEGSNISIFPSSVYECNQGAEDTTSLDANEETREAESGKEESEFKKSIKSRLVVAQVVATITSNARFTFDYLLLIVLASVIACLGLAENSSVVLVASMLISPLMGPILAATFGQVIENAELRNLGLRSELAGLSICLIVGFFFGLITGGLGLHGAVWGSADEWPTNEMKSRGMLRSLWVGILIALPSGAGVAISVLGGNAGSLVGVAISASLLPPAVNAGMLWAYGFLAAIRPPDAIIPDQVISTANRIVTDLVNATVVNGSAAAPYTTVIVPGGSSISTSTLPPVSPNTTAAPTQTIGSCFPLYNNAYIPQYSCTVSHDAALLGCVSLLLTILNICCIFIMGVLVLKIKEVAPHTAVSTSTDQFWEKDVKVARTYYQTSKGQTSVSLGKQFLNEWKKLKEKEHDTRNLDTLEEEEEEPVQILHFRRILQDVENSSYVRSVKARLSPATNVESPTYGLDELFDEAAVKINERIWREPSVYMAEPQFRGKGQKLMDSVYNTIHSVSVRPDNPLASRRDRLQKASSLFIETSKLPSSSDSADFDNRRGSAGMKLQSPTRNPLFRKRRKVKFQVTKVEEGEDQELV